MAERETQTMGSARMTMSSPSKLPQPAHSMHQHFALTTWIMISRCPLYAVTSTQPKHCEALALQDAVGKQGQLLFNGHHFSRACVMLPYNIHLCLQ